MSRDCQTKYEISATHQSSPLASTFEFLDSAWEKVEPKELGIMKLGLTAPVAELLEPALKLVVALELVVALAPLELVELSELVEVLMEVLSVLVSGTLVSAPLESRSWKRLLDVSPWFRPGM